MCDALADVDPLWPPVVLFSGSPETAPTVLSTGQVAVFRIEYDVDGATLWAEIDGEPVDASDTDGVSLFYTHWLNSGGPWR
jgi:hypothetical protein